MVLYKYLMTSQSITPFKLEGVDVDAYSIIKTITVNQTYSKIYLKTMRFILFKDLITIPYMCHLKWMDNSIVDTELQKTMSLNKILSPAVVEQYSASYSTLCEIKTVLHTLGGKTYLLFEMNRNHLVKAGMFTSTTFEMFFTDENGVRMYSEEEIPNVEIEFEIF